MVPAVTVKEVMEEKTEHEKSKMNINIYQMFVGFMHDPENIMNLSYCRLQINHNHNTFFIRGKIQLVIILYYTFICFDELTNSQNTIN